MPTQQLPLCFAPKKAINLPINFRLNSLAETSGIKAKAMNNLKAIELSQTIYQENRLATVKEQEILANYLGWGMAPEVFEEPLKPNWQNIGNLLRTLLTSTNYQSARASILNAYYTSPAIVKAIYQGLIKLGFTGGRILEPSMGSGLFIGIMPEQLSQHSTWTGVEIDPTTGLIAQQLYPSATIHVRGFQEVMLPHNHFDLAIGNVPFGTVVPHDPEYNRIGLRNLHDYFFAKTVDLVKPGGLVILITSVGTMQSSKSQALRWLLREKVNLVGAMRLPNNAFQQFTNTSVTTDLIVLQKLSEEIVPNQIDWISTRASGLQDEDGRELMLPTYYVQHPEMLLGTSCIDKLYSGRNRLGLMNDGRNLTEAIASGFEQLLNQYSSSLSKTETPEPTTLNIPNQLQGAKQYSFVWHENQPWQVFRSSLRPIEVEGLSHRRLFWLVQIKDALREIFEIQVNNGSDRELITAQKQLTNLYDKFIAKGYGWIHSTANRRVFAEDPEYPLLLALENYDRDTEVATKTEIFSTRTIKRHEPKTSANCASSALVYSLSEKGGIDLEYIGQLRSSPPLNVIKELQTLNQVYQDPDTMQWHASDEYLSGNVKRKLKSAIARTTEQPEFQTNVSALLAVQPQDLPPGDIYARLGSPWLPSTDIVDFIAEILNVSTTEVEVNHSPATARWEITASGRLIDSKNNNEIYGTTRINACRLIELALNLKVPVIRDSVEKDNTIENKEETRRAQSRQENLKTQFKRWLWSNLARANRLARLYNEQYNCLVPRRFNGSHLELPGMNPTWRKKIRPHQLNAIWRTIATGNTLLCHPVGAGKTAVAIATAVELKRLHFCHKPALVVMDHLPEQMASEALQLYPRMKILIAGSTEMSARRRTELASRIATDDWDLVIISHTAFNKLPLRPKSVQRFIQEESDLIEKDYIEEIGRGKRPKRMLKQLERKVSQLQEKIKAVALDTSKDNTVYFDDLGIDWIIYDESQCAKNLRLNTKLNRVLGVPSSASYRAEDFYQKTRFMASIQGNGRGITLMTATPISNTMAEAWVNQKYLQYNTLKTLGLLHFDGWVSNFAEIKIAAEITAQGTLEIKHRLALFHNLPEWRQLFTQVADVVSEAELKIAKPKAEYVTVEAPASPEQLAFFHYIAERARKIKSGLIKPEEDNMPWITSHIRQGVVNLQILPAHILENFLTAKQITNLPDSPSKVHVCIKNLWQVHQQTAAERLTQLVFCDIGTPKEKPDDRYTVYHAIKSGLITLGISAKEIAFIHDAKTDEQKDKLFRAVRFGQIRILIGSTSKMGVGTNVQNYVVASHSLDCPFRPTDHTQREGRSIRQGNTNSQVKLFRYVTQGKPYQDNNGKQIAGLSPDSYLYQTSVTKARFIEEALSPTNRHRSIEDCSEVVLSYQEVMAAATGDPRLIRKVELDTKVNQLQAEERDAINLQASITRELEQLPQQITAAKLQIEIHSQDRHEIQPTEGDLFQIKLSIPGKKQSAIKLRKQAGTAINELAAKQKAATGYQTIPIGSFGGFPLELKSDISGSTLLLVGRATYTSAVRTTPLGTISALEHTLANSINSALNKASSSLHSLEKSQQELRTQLGLPFAASEELLSATAELHQLNQDLGINENDQDEQLLILAD